MDVRNAKLEDMKQAGYIMSVSFRSAFAGFISGKTLDACAREDACIALLEGIFQEGKMHFLMGENKGLLVWQEHDGDLAEIAAIHSLPESWGTGLGQAMLAEALTQIRAAGKQAVFLWAFQENARARRFYEKHGFRWDGAERVSEFDGAVEVRYCCRLAEE